MSERRLRTAACQHPCKSFNLKTYDDLAPPTNSRINATSKPNQNLLLDLNLPHNDSPPPPSTRLRLLPNSIPSPLDCSSRHHLPKYLPPPPTSTPHLSALLQHVLVPEIPHPAFQKQRLIPNYRHDSQGITRD